MISVFELAAHRLSLGQLSSLVSLLSSLFPFPLVVIVVCVTDRLLLPAGFAHVARTRPQPHPRDRRGPLCSLALALRFSLPPLPFLLVLILFRFFSFESTSIRFCAVGIRP